MFIHGFISSSAFWTETVFRHLSEEARARYRLFAVDLLGFGKSPKPADSLYTLREHVQAIERSVLQRHRVKSFHLVAHSLGSLLALALAVKHPGAVKSLTILAPVWLAHYIYLMRCMTQGRRHAVQLTNGVKFAAIFSGAQGGAGDAIHAPAGGAATRVAADHVRVVGDLLVRAHQPDRLPRPLQAPSLVGARLQIRDEKQVH